MNPKPVALSNLLLAVAAMVFAMVVVGGITRLTESGLSITEWKPLSGAIPPLSADDWARAFGLYQQTPEYREINGPAGMTLAQFKQIYWWEFIHRLLGRVIGLVFAGGLLWFAARREIPRGYGWKHGGAAGARRAAGRARLVHGDVGPRRADRRQPHAPRRASDAGAGHHGRADLGRARPSQGPAGAADRLFGRRARRAGAAGAARRLGCGPERGAGGEHAGR